MKPDEILAMSAAVSAAQTLLGQITILKERLAWFEAGETIIVSFDRGSSNQANTSSRPVLISLDSSAKLAVLAAVGDSLRLQLAAKQAEFDALTF